MKALEIAAESAAKVKALLKALEKLSGDFEFRAGDYEALCNVVNIFYMAQDIMDELIKNIDDAMKE